MRKNMRADLVLDPLVPLLLISARPENFQKPELERVVLPPGEIGPHQSFVMLKLKMLVREWPPGSDQLPGFVRNGMLGTDYRREAFEKLTGSWKS